MIVIPDIHGRTFWKYAVSQKEENEKVIFLGDYLDPYSGEIDNYTGEVITESGSLDNFKEILEYKKNNNEDTILLLGNHDVEYFLPYCASCRENTENKEEIKKLFLDNILLFKISYIEKCNNILYLFSHAGFSEYFMYLSLTDSEFNSKFPYGVLSLKLNNKLIDLDRCNDIDKFSDLGKILGLIGPERGGRNKCGSCVWADYEELLEWNNNYTKGTFNLYQIIGHSQYSCRLPYMDEPNFLINEHMACLDCRVAFRLNPNDKKFTPLTTTIRKK